MEINIGNTVTVSGAISASFCAGKRALCTQHFSISTMRKKAEMRNETKELFFPTFLLFLTHFSVSFFYIAQKV